VVECPYGGGHFQCGGSKCYLWVVNLPKYPTRFKLVWEAAKNGQFSVKSAYHVAMEMGRRYAGSSSSEGSSSDLWRRIWRISGPRVVKLFMWQACNDILPTNENLLKWKVLTEALCPIR
jgi:hypothetical protein